MNFARPIILLAATLAVAGVTGCKRSEEPPPDYLKTQREAMERAKEVGKTMQKAVDQEGRKADEEGK
jgi:hypothetical protein